MNTIQYNTKYVCTYIDSELFEDDMNKGTGDVYNEDYNEDDADKEDKQNELYQKDFLSVFNIKEYDGEQIGWTLNDLEVLIGNSTELKKGLVDVSIILESDKSNAIVYLFSYRLLYFTHHCLCEYINDGKIKEDTLSDWYLNIEKIFGKARTGKRLEEKY
jgi:hypothetical protein